MGIYSLWKYPFVEIEFFFYFRKRRFFFWEGKGWILLFGGISDSANLFFADETLCNRNKRGNAVLIFHFMLEKLYKFTILTFLEYLMLFAILGRNGKKFLPMNLLTIFYLINKNKNDTIYYIVI